MNSSRKYKITYFDREDVKEMEVKIQDIIGITDTDFNDLEMQYSLQEILDEILDMKLWERKVFLEDRNDENSLSIIIRID